MKENNDKKTLYDQKTSLARQAYLQPQRRRSQTRAHTNSGCDPRDAGLEAGPGGLPGGTGWRPCRSCPAALAERFRLFMVSGGDGAISAVAHSLAGTDATLGIIPIGTQNDTALSLNIPDDVAVAIAILRTGRRIKVDMGRAACDKVTTPFLEACSVGLASALFPTVDDIQHGDLAQTGNMLATLASTPPSKIHLLLDNKKEIHAVGHVVLVFNMPQIGSHYQLGSLDSFKDGLLDVLFFAELNKLELLGYVLQGVGEGKPEDPRIQHFHARKVEIETDPSMPVLTDGNMLGEGLVRIEVRRRAHSVMAGPETTET